MLRGSDLRYDKRGALQQSIKGQAKDASRVGVVLVMNNGLITLSRSCA